MKYDIFISYNQKAPIKDKQYEGTKISTTTCFGAPDRVTNLKAEENSDGDLLISWQPPIKINAPRVCYYEVVVTETQTSSSKYDVWLHF